MASAPTLQQVEASVIIAVPGRKLPASVVCGTPFYRDCEHVRVKVFEHVLPQRYIGQTLRQFASVSWAGGAAQELFDALV
eukprot:4726894-Amphidinium_carterae.1